MGIENLSAHDRAVLNCIFDPTATLSDVTALDEDFILDHDEDEQCGNEELRRAKELEIEAVKHAEAKEYERALTLLEETLSLTPQRPASYNNRAQLLRLLGRDTDALQDLEKAIQLSEGSKSRARAKALCQRGLLMRKLEKEDEAKRDFDEAAKLGSAFAKKQMVEMNPYAALCNKMLRQVMKNDVKSDEWLKL